ncbi:MAG TPA: formate dehydrogenase subunit delta [Pseudonocardiaceae bacterium]|jgi:formate dehydrogenase subunit delta
MADARIARLVNDIAVQFAHQPLPVAAESVARHVITFWEPRMRAALLAMPAAATEELDERAKAALVLIRRGG